MKIERKLRRLARRGEGVGPPLGEGGDPELAPLALEFLEAIGLKATFLLDPARAKVHPEPLLRILEPGREVAASEARPPTPGEGSRSNANGLAAGGWPCCRAGRGRVVRLGFFCVRRQSIVFWSSAGPEPGDVRRQVGRIEVEAVAAGRVTLLREACRPEVTMAALERILNCLMQNGIRPLSIGEALVRGKKG